MKIYEESMLIRTSNCDLTGRWRASDILSFLQEGAGVHSHLLGCGRDVMLQNNIIWVLSRTELVMDRYPVVGETVRMETFPMPNRRWFFPRYYLLYDEQNRLVGKAGTLWLLMDCAERKMAPPETALPYLPDNSDMTAPLPFPGNIALVEGDTVVTARTPAYTDIDVNQHVNNTRYADWLCDALGVQAMRQKEIARMLIHYNHEILPETEIQLALERRENDLRMSGTHGETRHFEIGATLRDR